jgi:hypothetical protein
VIGKKKMVTGEGDDVPLTNIANEVAESDELPERPYGVSTL